MTIMLSPLLKAYVMNPLHRTPPGNPNKSQWTINAAEEENCFLHAYQEGWIDANGKVWGLHITGGKAQYLGVPAINSNHSEPLYIGKFLDDDGYGNWHGYPADCRTNGTRDIPPSAVREAWLSSRLVRKRVITLLAKGKLCAL